MSTLPPIHREVVVRADAATAFEVFTGRIGAWWPLAELSVAGPGASVAFVDGVLLETAPDGSTTAWGEVTEWRPGERVAFTWHPGRAAARSTSVVVDFVPYGEHTLVVLEHDGWERLADAVAARREYGHGWPGVLDRFAAAAGSGQGPEEPAEERAEEAWVVLEHRPVDAPAGGVFQDPRFAEHAAFLQRRRAAGQLVAAGPLADALGEGMTVLRLSGAGALEEARRLATQDDRAVTGGLFTVTVRPWNVTMRG